MAKILGEVLSETFQNLQFLFYNVCSRKKKKCAYRVSDLVPGEHLQILNSCCI